MKFPTIRLELRVPLLYALFGGLWILLSDRLLAAFITDASTMTTLQTFKGWGFVLFSSLLIFLILRHDLSLRQIAENKSHESEHRLRKFYESNLVGVVYWNMQGKITEANDKFLEMVGYTRDDLATGRIDWVNMTPPEYRHLDDASVSELQSTGINRTPFEKEYIRKDGTRMPIILAGAMLDEARFNGVAFVLDITERKQAEQKLAQYSEHLEETVQARTNELRDAQEQLVRQEKLAVLGQLAGGVGHELRNPLAVINNALYYLKLVGTNGNEKVKEYLGIIETEAHTAEKIITDLLDFARIKSVDREPVSASEIVMRVLERYPTPKTVCVRLEIPEELPNVFVDPRQMEQVLGNLVINACQSMTTGGVSTGCDLVISAFQDQEMIAIAVKDTGVGIPPENMKRLFEPLFTTKVKGIGLGLAVSQKLVEANSGRIEVQSEAGKGTTFTVYLPIKAKVYP